MDRLFRAVAGFYTGVVPRFYGLFFVGLGGVFLYWSARGFLAYAHGIREAWADPTACVIGLVVGPLSLWAGIRLVRNPSQILSRLSSAESELDRTIARAMELEKTDPAASRQLLDGYFAREAAATEARRADLWRRAPAGCDRRPHAARGAQQGIARQRTVSEGDAP